jgi:hypothetical protein
MAVAGMVVAMVVVDMALTEVRTINHANRVPITPLHATVVGIALAGMETVASKSIPLEMDR